MTAFWLLPNYLSMCCWWASVSQDRFVFQFNKRFHIFCCLMKWFHRLKKKTSYSNRCQMWDMLPSLILFLQTIWASFVGALWHCDPPIEGQIEKKRLRLSNRDSFQMRLWQTLKRSMLRIKKWHKPGPMPPRNEPMGSLCKLDAGEMFARGGYSCLFRWMIPIQFLLDLLPQFDFKAPGIPNEISAESWVGGIPSNNNGIRLNSSAPGKQSKSGFEWWFFDGFFPEGMKIAMFHHQLREDLFGTFFNTQPSNPTLTLWVIFFLSTMVNKLENAVFFPSTKQAILVSGIRYIFKGSIFYCYVDLPNPSLPEVRTSAGLEGGSLANEGFLRRLSFSGVMKMGPPFWGDVWIIWRDFPTK